MRLISIRHGLPFVYNPDEELHFVPAAARAAHGDLDPHYFENPSGFTYVVAAALRIAFLGQDLPTLLTDDPTAVFFVARLVSVGFGILTVAATYAVALRTFDSTTGLWASALVGMAFLPVFYSHQALNDAATLLPATLAVGACVNLYRRGLWRDAVVAGGLVGLAAAFKYLAAPLALIVALAVLIRVASGRQTFASAVVHLVASAGAFFAGLLVLNPYIALGPSRFWSSFAGQSGQASTGKLGQDGSAWIDYPVSLVWGLGLVPALLALVGAVLLFRRNRALAMMLILFPVVLYLYMATQGRWFGRWLLPSYPALVLLAAYAAKKTTGLMARVVPFPIALSVACVLILGQSVADVGRSDLVLSRTDTRQIALDWIGAEVPPGSGLVIEPAFPVAYLSRLGEMGFRVRPTERPFQDYELSLEPALFDTYRAEGYCWVVTSTHQKERGIVARVPGALAYYQVLQTEGDLELTASPYRPGADAPDFSYDFSFNYYPPAHYRPGPVVEIYRLDDC